MASAALTHTLTRYGISEDELLVEFGRYLTGVPEPASAELTVEQERFLQRHSGVRLPDDWDARDAARFLAGMMVDNAAEAVRGSVTVEETARWLGVHPSRVRHRISDGALYGFKVGKHLRLPAWQFDRADGETPDPIPGLRTVLASLAGDAHPLEISTFMTTPDADLVIDDRPVSPREWLVAGGDATPVAALAAELGAAW
jgi:excisionase family DNA binding protein